MYYTGNWPFTGPKRIFWQVSFSSPLWGAEGALPAQGAPASDLRPEEEADNLRGNEDAHHDAQRHEAGLLSPLDHGGHVPVDEGVHGVVQGPAGQQGG